MKYFVIQSKKINNEQIVEAAVNTVELFPATADGAAAFIAEAQRQGIQQMAQTLVSTTELAELKDAELF